MITRVGSQIREPIEDTEYLVDFLDEPGIYRSAFLINTATDKREHWTQNDDYAGYVIVIDGVGFEFLGEL